MPRRIERIDFHLTPGPASAVVCGQAAGAALVGDAVGDGSGTGLPCAVPGGADTHRHTCWTVRPPHRRCATCCGFLRAFDGFERVTLGDQNALLARHPVGRAARPGMRPFLESLRINATVFSNRLPGTLNDGLEARFIPRSRDIGGDQAVLIGRVWDSASARPLHDRRAFAATTSRDYSVRSLLDRLR